MPSSCSRCRTRSTDVTCSRRRRRIWRRVCRSRTLGPAIAVEGLVVVELPGPMVAAGAIGARVTGVDGFGNVQLNVGPNDLEAAGIGPILTVRGSRGPPGGHLRRPAGGHARGHHRLAGAAGVRRQPGERRRDARALHGQDRGARVTPSAASSGRRAERQARELSGARGALQLRMVARRDHELRDTRPDQEHEQHDQDDERRAAHVVEASSGALSGFAPADRFGEAVLHGLAHRHHDRPGARRGRSAGAADPPRA